MMITIDRDRLEFVVISVAVLEIVFWSSVMYWKMIEKYDLFGFKSKYAIKNKRSEATPELKSECLREVLLGHLLVRPVLLYLVYPFLKSNLDMSNGLLGFPDAKTILLHVFLSAQIDDFLFYWSHRILHHKMFYVRFHKKHHMFRKPTALATEFADPVEDALNTLATALPPVLLGSHSSVFLLYTCLKLNQSIEAHSGFDLPFPYSLWNCRYLGMDCAGAHDYHHSHNSGNFGGFFMFWDWAMGTDRTYRKHCLQKN